MKKNKCVQLLAYALLTVAATLPAAGQDKKAEKPSDADMMATMMALAQPGENHKMLMHSVGTWDYKVKFWMAPDAPPSESIGTTVTKAIMGGRYFISEHNGKMQMPGKDGKMTEMAFNGIGTEGYDNVKKKFVASWIDNMGTGIMNLEGTYDAPNKTLTYTAEYEPMPGMKSKVREVIKIADNDHRMFEWFEDQGGKEVKTMEITYTRKKA